MENNVEELSKRLEVANSLLRSAYQIAVRRGKGTYWEGFEKQLKEELDIEHKLMYPNGQQN